MSSPNDGSMPAEVPLINPSVRNTVLGRPTDSSIAVSVLAGAAGDQMYIEYGTQLDAAGAAILDAKMTTPVTSQKGEPMVIDVTGLS